MDHSQLCIKFAASTSIYMDFKDFATQISPSGKPLPKPGLGGSFFPTSVDGAPGQGVRWRSPPPGRLRPQ